MRLKNTTIVIVAFVICANSYAQNYKDIITEEFNNYLQTILNQDFKKSMDYIVEDVFEIVPKENMITLLETAFKTPGIDLSLENPKIISIGDAKVIDKKSYVLLEYSNIMKMKFLEDDNEIDQSKNKEETAKDKKTKNALVRVSLAKSFGDENIKYHEDSKVYEIFAKKEAYAISKNGKSKWKFIVVEKNQKAFLELFLPKVLTNKI